MYYYSLLPVAASLHIIDEFVYPGGFLDVMRETSPRIGRHVTVRFGVIINSSFFLLCVLAALFGPKKRTFGLSVLSLVFLNGLMHVAGTVARRRYNPGAATGVLLYIPLAIAGFRDAQSSGDLSRRQVIEAVSLAVAYQAVPMVTLLVKDLCAKTLSTASG
jgi:hypothetical protein